MFEDDYGIAYTITERTWLQHPGTRYHVHEWNAHAGYLIAQNDSANANGGRWTRIDWMRLEGMAPYTWAYCLSTYDAPTAAAAARARVVQRETPRTGCNGFPFSRMKPRTAADR